MLLGLKEIIDLGSGIGRNRKIRILVHRIQVGVRLLVPHIVLGKEILGDISVAQNIKVGSGSQGGGVESWGTVRIHRIAPFENRGVVFVRKIVPSTWRSGGSRPLRVPVINLVAAIINIPATEGNFSHWMIRVFTFSFVRCFRTSRPASPTIIG